MAIQATCSYCGTKLAYSGSATGTTKPCPKCHAPVTFGTEDPAWPPSKPEAPRQSAEVVGDVIEPPAKPATATAIVEPAKKPGSIWWVLIPVGVAGGGLLMLIVLCAGIGAFVISKSHRDVQIVDSSKGGDSAYYGSTTSQPYESSYTPDPYAQPSTYAPAEPSFSTPTYSQPPAYTPPVESYPTPPSDPGFFNFYADRATELEALIAQDRQKLTEINIALGFVAAGRSAGGKALESESALDQLIGIGAEALAEGSRAELETEKSLIQGRISAYQQELAGLRR